MQQLMILLGTTSPSLCLWHGDAGKSASTRGKSSNQEIE